MHEELILLDEHLHDTAPDEAAFEQDTLKIVAQLE